MTYRLYTDLKKKTFQFLYRFGWRKKSKRKNTLFNTLAIENSISSLQYNILSREKKGENKIIQKNPRRGK